MTETRERVLDAAERLFAEQGYAGTSLRSIVAAAGVNLAAIHYHFRSKESLLEAVVVRRAAPANRERLLLLDRCKVAARSRKPTLEKLLEAFLIPTFRAVQDSAGAVQFMRLIARIHAEGYLLPAIAKANFGEVIASYTEACLQALPHLTPDEFRWRAHLAAGAVAQALRAPEWFEGDDPAAAEETLQRLIGFLSAGFRVPMKNMKSRGSKCSAAS